MTLAAIGGWWLIGIIIWLHVVYLINHEIKVIDLFIAPLVGIVGPLGALYYLMVLDQYGPMDKVIYRRKSR